MLTEFLESLLKNSQASDITELFLMALIGIMIFSLLISPFKFGRGMVNYTPTLLTSLGILGTFVGIVVGLMAFQPTDIDGSIETLLEGLKTAFITSLAGMGCAIIFKILTLTVLVHREPKSKKVSVASPEDILNTLNDQRDILQGLKDSIGGEADSSLVGQFKLARADANDHHKTQLNAYKVGLEEIRRLQKGLSGDEESSLVGQTRLLRSDVNDNHRALAKIAEENRESQKAFADLLWRQLNEFAEMMSKSATEQVINALKEVIQDFNKNLTEQFGENFKALDASVQRLVEWQENYRQQLEQMSAQYAQGVEAITQTEASVAHISEESKQIPVTMELLKSVLEVNQHQLQELERHLDAFREMKDKAVEAVPEIRQQVQKTIEDVASSVETASEHYRKLLDLSDAYIEAHDQKTQELLERFIQTTNYGIGLVQSSLDESANSVRTAIVSGADRFDASVQQIQANLGQTSEVLVNQTAKINDEFKAGVQNIHQSVQGMVNDLSKESDAMLTTLTQAGKRTQEDTQRIQNEVSEGIQAMQRQLEKALQEIYTEQAKAMESATKGIMDEMGKAVARTGDGVNKQLSAIDEAMQKEINRVMNEMGTALAKITGQFSKDYSSLVAAMADITKTGLGRR